MLGAPASHGGEGNQRRTRHPEQVTGEAVGNLEQQQVTLQTLFPRIQNSHSPAPVDVLLSTPSHSLLSRNSVLSQPLRSCLRCSFCASVRAPGHSRLLAGGARSFRTERELGAGSVEGGGGGYPSPQGAEGGAEGLGGREAEEGRKVVTHLWGRVSQLLPRESDRHRVTSLSPGSLGKTRSTEEVLT